MAPVALLLSCLVALSSLFAAADASLYGKTSPVIELTTSNFKQQVLNSDHAWMVEFFAPWCGHCKRLAPEYEKAAGNVKGLVRLGAVNCDDQANQPLCGQYGIQGFPTIKMFAPSSKAPVDYQGERSARAIVDYALQYIPNHVKKIKSANFDSLIATEPARTPVAVLFTAKTVTTPLWKALSAEYRNRIVFAEVQSTEKALVERFGIAKFPAILLFDKESTEPVTYDGTLAIEQLMSFFNQYAPTKASGSTPPPPPPPTEPPVVEKPFNPEVMQIRTSNDLKEECLDKPIGLCLIAFLDVQPESETHEAALKEHLEILRTIKNKYYKKGAAYHIMWVNAHEQEALRTQFDLSDQLPNAMILAPRKGRYLPFMGAFDESSLSEFLDDTFHGRGRSFKLPGEPIITETA